MSIRNIRMIVCLAIATLNGIGFQTVNSQQPVKLIRPEQRCLDVRDPEQLCTIPIPDSAAPFSVSNPYTSDFPIRPLSLDEAIRIALENARVIRVLNGLVARTSGRTIYDTAIANTGIDEARGRFDPLISLSGSTGRTETPQFIFDINNPSFNFFGGPAVDTSVFDFNLSKTLSTGATFNFGVNAARTDTSPSLSLLNPQTRTSTELSFTQPLLQGGGIRANLAPIVVARINTERSYFQFKDSVQELVRGVIEAYWNLVFARIDLWAREQQVRQLKAAFELESGRFEENIANVASVAQTKVALRQFEASLIQAETNVFTRQGVLRNILGWAPADEFQIVPTTPPSELRLRPNHNELFSLAEQRRPDIVELKLILDADEQLLLQARNAAQPRLDFVSLYRWNGLEGELPIGGIELETDGGFADWSMSVNFSLPVGLRQARANMRGQELTICRDSENLQQGIHSMVHEITLSLRLLDQAYEQYEQFIDVREAALENLKVQAAQFQASRVNFIVALDAITDWGNAVSSEANSLTQYNTLLANLERQTGTILESHGIVFREEQYGSIGPLGRLARRRPCYPSAVAPNDNVDRYQDSGEPAEEAFDLTYPELNIRPLTQPESGAHRPVVPSAPIRRYR